MDPARSREEVASLYRRHVAMVYQICLVLLKNVPDAEDASQNVFRKVMEYQKPFQSPDHERAWLITAARNECKKSAQALVAHPTGGRIRVKHPDLGTAGGRGAVGADFVPAGEIPAGALSPLLPGLYRPGDGEILGENPSTVRTWLVQARKKLKERWEAEHSGRS